jgi:hypothetical protein
MHLEEDLGKKIKQFSLNLGKRKKYKAFIDILHDIYCSKGLNVLSKEVCYSAA